jgi:16S rRNA (uracil1498-N3)-methyltransferase
MRRFFVRPEDVHGPELRLRQDETVHLARALRLGPGTCIVAFDGLGHEYEATVERLGDAEVLCRIVRQREARAAHTLSIALGQGLPKADTFEWIIQKTTELGVAEIVPLLTDRVVPHMAARRIDAKVTRWQKLAREACKQCGRSAVPRLSPPTALETFCLTFSQVDLKLLLWERAGTRPLRPILEACGPIASAALIIGPEGGLTRAEVDRGESYGFCVVSLGERIMRTETASMAMVALLQYLFGDLG